MYYFLFILYFQVDTNIQDAGGGQYYFTLEQVEGLNHIVVFLTGQVPFTEGFVGGIYFGASSDEGGIAWQYLGFISNEKPSAIFKISNIKPSPSAVNPFGEAMMASLAEMSSTTALIGITVEPALHIAQLTPASNTQASNVDSFTEFSTKMVENFFNYASSFAVLPAQTPINPMENYVPLTVLQSWYETFMRRLQSNPNFWKTL